jgi:hypothetical protein
MAKKTQSSLGNMFNPKHIIFDAVKKRLVGTGINKLVLYFNVLNNKYNVMLSTNEDRHLKLDIEQDEITMLRKVLINKLHTTAQQNMSAKVKAIIISIDLSKESFDTYVEDEKENVTVFQT